MNVKVLPEFESSSSILWKKKEEERFCVRGSAAHTKTPVPILAKPRNEKYTLTSNSSRHYRYVKDLKICLCRPNL